MKIYCHLLLCSIFIFYLGLHKGNLAVFREHDTKPLYRFAYSIDLFPNSDQQALRSGIPFSDREELSRLLEDYLS